MERLRIGARGSRLSRIQVDEVVSLIRGIKPGIRIEYKYIKTSGDIDRESPLYLIKSRGVFVREVDRALLNGEVDLAIHSAKDVPLGLIDKRLEVIAIPRRLYRHDILLTRHGLGLRGLAPGSVIGTSSIRRASFLKSMRSDLEIRNIRGNIDTRISKLYGGQYDGLILSEASVRRLGIRARYERLPIERFTPSAGQGGIIVLTRRDLMDEIGFIEGINDDVSYAEVMIEKMIISRMGVGCSIPIGVTGIYDHSREEISIYIGIIDPDGNKPHYIHTRIFLPRKNLRDMDVLRTVSEMAYMEFRDYGGLDVLRRWDGRGIKYVE